MHELGIVFYIIDDVTEVAQQNGVTKVASVTLELGEVSGVVPELLQDAWKWAAHRTELMDGAELICETVHARTVCDDCNLEYDTVAHGRICPECGSEHTHLLCGREVMIKEIEALET